MQAAAAAAASETPPAETAAAAVSLGGLEGAEEKGVEATATQAAEAVAAETATAMGPGARRFEMVLVPPDDAHVITIQRLIRGMLMRSTYKTLKVFVFVSRFFVSRGVAAACLVPCHVPNSGWYIAAARLATTQIRFFLWLEDRVSKPRVGTCRFTENFKSTLAKCEG